MLILKVSIEGQA